MYGKCQFQPQSQHAYDYSRLALARYETLPQTGEEFRLQQAAPSLPSRYRRNETRFSNKNINK